MDAESPDAAEFPDAEDLPGAAEELPGADDRPEADALEQRQALREDGPAVPRAVPDDVDALDRLDQERVVALDEDDYR